ncbi:MAG: hypothetical protein ABFS18_01065 [Thermodesulfobacteriota bacterium]
MNRLFFILLLLIFATATLVSAAEWREIDGTYAITSKNMVSPIEDSHLKIQLKGGSARDLYNAMKVKETFDECTGGMSRSVGEMECIYYTSTQKYECHFSIDIMEQKVELGVPC